MLTPGATPSSREQQTLEAIRRRRTHRGKFEHRPLSQRLADSLAAAARREKATLFLNRDADVRRRIEDLVAEGRRRQFSDPAYREELSGWIQDRERENQMVSAEAGWRTGRIGMNTAGQVPEPRLQPDLFVQMATQAARMFGSPQRQEASVEEDAGTGPVLVLLTTTGDTKRDWLMVGQALQAVLLRATAAGVSASYLSPPLEVAALRQQVAEAFHAEGNPQVLMKLGYAAERAPVARRPVVEVLN